MLKIALLAGAAGFIGTLLRFGIVRAIPGCGFPWGTLAVNLLGSFAAGFFFWFLRQRFPQYEVYFPVLFIGFFGAFTTFSTYALESARFLMNGETGKCLGNVLLQNVCGLTAAALGILLAKVIG